MSGNDWLILLLLSAFWGSSFLLIAIAIRDLPPFTIVAIRMAVAGLILYGVLRFLGRDLPRDGATWIMFIIVGATGSAAPFSLISWAQYQIPSGLAGVLNATTPMFTILFAELLTRDEKLSVTRLVGVGIGFLGVVIMIGFDAVRHTGGHVLAMLAVLLATVCFAYSAVYGKRFAEKGIPPLTVATGQCFGAALLTIPFAIVVDAPWTLDVPRASSVLAVIGLAAGSTALAYILLYRLLGRAGAVNLTLVTFLIPVVAVILGALLLGERLSIHHFTGMAIIGLGLAVIDGRPLGLLRRRIAG